MEESKIRELAQMANDVNEVNESPIRFWIVNGRYFICNNIEDEDDFDEVSKTKFINRIREII